MITDNHTSVVWQGRHFFGVRELGFNDSGSFIVSMHTTPLIDGQQGSYFTCIPISPLEFRREWPNSRVAFRDKGAELVLYDDWGTPHTIAAPRVILDKLVVECREQEIPEAPVS